MERRTALGLAVGAAIGALAGCQSSADPSLGSPTAGDDSDPAVTDACRASASDAEGGAPPWLDPKHPADVVINNARESAVVASVSADGARREIELSGGDYWISDDFIPDGTATSVAVAVDDLSETLDWSPERDNERVATFVVTDGAIRGRTDEKSCRDR